MKKYKYKAKSNLWRALITGHFNVFLFPDQICLDFDKKEFETKGRGASYGNLKEIIGVDIIYHKKCADLDIETSHGNIHIRCVNTRVAQKLKTLLDSYIWKRNQKQTNN